MQSLRNELRVIAHQVGDKGSPDVISLTIDTFVDKLEELFTPLALGTFDGNEMRSVYFWYVENITLQGPPTARDLMQRFIPGCPDFPSRPLPVIVTPGQKVVRLH